MYKWPMPCKALSKANRVIFVKNYNLKKVLHLAKSPDIVKRSLMVSLIVGTILNLINQGEMLSDLGSLNLIKCLLTYIVPYLVATYGAVMSLLDIEK